MSIDEIIDVTSRLDGVLTLRPMAGDGSPPIAWGDVFFYYAPDGVLPRAQPFATIVTKDYPDDATSGLDRPGAHRVNVHVGRSEAAALLADVPTAAPDDRDALIAHPVYGAAGWLAVVEPGPVTRDLLRGLIEAAHRRAVARRNRRPATGRGDAV